MNTMIFVLVLASADGGINTDLRFTDMMSCRESAKALTAFARDRSDVFGDSIGFRYVRAICVPAKNLVK